MGDAVKWGIVSTANINAKVIPGAKASPKVDLVAVASRTQDRADTYAKGKGSTVARVIDGRLPRPGRGVELPVEYVALDLAGRVIVVIVEPHLPRGDDARVGQPLGQPRTGLGGPARGHMGMHAGGGGEPGIAGGEPQGAVGRLGRVPDDDHVADAGRARPRHHLAPIGVIGRIGEVAVRVDEHVSRPAAPCGTWRRPPRSATSARGCGDRASAARWP